MEYFFPFLADDDKICPNAASIGDARDRCVKLSYFCEQVTPVSWENFPHSHEHCEIMFALRGSYRIFAGGRIFYPKRGDIRTYASGELHMGQILCDCVYEGFQFSIPKSVGETLGRLGLMTCFTDRRFGERNEIVSQSKDEIIRLLYELHSHIGSGAAYCPTVCCGLFIAVMGIVNQSFINGEGAHAPQTLPPLVSAVIADINENFTSIKSLSDIALRAKISVPYLVKLFAVNLGCSPYKYLTAKKLSRAKMLLLEGASVTSACYESGFEDYSNFITLFRKHTGVTPLAYKRGEAGEILSGLEGGINIL